MIARLLTLCFAAVLGAAEPIRVYYAARPGALERSRALIAAGDETAKQAFKKLVADADKALLVGPPSVTAKAKVPPSGDKHDYLSLAPYFWPDPSKPDGLPYLRKDGQVNPESRDEAANDTLRMRLLGKSVETLGLAYHFTKDERYAAHAARMLRVWFLAPETRMNPHLRYAQAVAGKNDGRGTGILESRYVGFAADAAGLLQGSPAWTETDRKQFDQWLGVFLDWLLTSAPGKDEAAAKNNHGASSRPCLGSASRSRSWPTAVSRSSSSGPPRSAIAAITSKPTRCWPISANISGSISGAPGAARGPSASRWIS
jgi:hypothetical protein